MPVPWFRRWLLGGMVVVLIIICIWQTTRYAAEWFQEPLATTIESQTPDFQGFESITVCTQNWANETVVNETGIDVFAYMLRFFPNLPADAEHVKNLEMLRAWTTPEKISVAREKYATFINTVKWPVNEISALQEVRLNSDFGESVNQSIFVKKGEVFLHNVDPRMGCLKVHPFRPPAPPVTLSRRDLEDGTSAEYPNFRFLAPTKDIFDDKRANKSKTTHIAVTLYESRDVQYYSLRHHFEDFMYLENGENHASAGAPPLMQHVTMKVAWTKVVHYHGRVHKCTVNPDKSRRPFGSATQKCRTICEEFAIRKVLNCTAGRVSGLNSLLGINSTKLLDCNTALNSQNVYNGEKLPTALMIRSEKEKCFYRRRCQEKKFCVEHSLTVTSLIKGRKYAGRRLFGNVTFPGQRLHSVTLVLPNQMMLQTEYTTSTMSNFIGTVGGIIGFYLGASLLSMLGMLADCVSRKKDSESED